MSTIDRFKAAFDAPKRRTPEEGSDPEGRTEFHEVHAGDSLEAELLREIIARLEALEAR